MFRPSAGLPRLPVGNGSERGIRRRSQPPDGQGGGISVLSVIAIVAVMILLVAAFIFVLPSAIPGLTGVGGAQSSTTSTGSQSSLTESSSQGAPLSSPVIQNATADIAYPSDYQTLSSYALNIINQDRQAFNLSTVAQSPSAVAQQHADSMLFYGYFSHYDTQGLKPYMRYTLLGGVGSVEENIAFIAWSSPYFTSPSKVESAIVSLEHSMMYNDSVCCGNGHRDNILSPLHDRVAIGIAYNSTKIYFVEDFENYYASLSYTVSQDTVSLVGVPTNSSLRSHELAVFYDQTPTAQNATSLNSGPREYGPGTLIGGVLPPCAAFCPYFSSGITVYASGWTYNSRQISIAFSLSDFVQEYGPGVYTLYAMTGNDTSSALTSISIFVS